MSESMKKGPEDLGQARLTYAWEWFKYHASQRISMFNYFLIITGILANAYVALFKDGSQALITRGGWVLGAIGALTAIGFVMLDVRNKALVDRGTSVLEQLEKEAVFGGDASRLAGGPDPSVLFKHTGWIRGIEIVIAIVFLLVAIYAEPTARLAKPDKPTVSNRAS
jgi:hypothetical protein